MKKTFRPLYPIANLVLSVLLILPTIAFIKPVEAQTTSPIPISTPAPADEFVTPGISTLTATNITSDSATLQGNLASLGSADSADVSFEFGQTASYGSVTQAQNRTTVGPFSADVTGLNPDTSYHYRAGASSSAGTVYGIDFTFTTEPLATSPPASTPPDPVPTLPALKVTAQVKPDQGTEIKSASQKISLFVPEGAVSAPVDIELTEHTPGGSTGRRLLNLFTLTASDSVTKAEITTFSKDLQISIKHESGDLGGLDVATLRLYYLDATTKQWIPLSSQYDTQQKTLTAATNHFSQFGEQADPIQNGPGRVMAAQVDMHSGAATFSYPLELPPGPGGFQPKLNLTYNSSAVNEMKNKRSTGSWVGIGWTLHPGRITYDLSTYLYYLELNDGSYQLVSLDGVNYRTNPDMYFKITRSGNTWTVLDSEGTYYRFGGTTDSQQYAWPNDIQTYYRWDLSLMRDTNNNTATVSYVQDIFWRDNGNGTARNWVRSAHPTYLRYNNNLIEVSFNSSYDEMQETGVRYDNPIIHASGWGFNEAPCIMENRRLDSIEIKANTALIRKYAFAYNTTNRVDAQDYGGIYYSGKHMLTSLTQLGADGTSALPAMTFAYEDKQIYRYANGETGYYGNPGNPASIYWPYLTSINSGYAGTISFSYAQKPDTSALKIWTREVVDTKTINSGIGNSQSYTYSYITGSDPKPQYLGRGWEQKYRGFGEVQETDAAGNYAKHWFYTTGKVDGKDGDKLSGREYKTQWYSSGAALLREKRYDWNYYNTSQTYDVRTLWSSDGKGDSFISLPPVEISSTGNIYAAYSDYNNNITNIQKFDEHGNFVLKFGSWGFNNGQMIFVSGIAVDGQGYVYASDAYPMNQRIQKFTSSGTYVTKWTSAAKGLAIDSQGYIYAACGTSIQKFTSTGTLVTQWGSYGSGNGQFIEAWDVAVDSQDYVYVADTGNNRIQKFTSSGTYVTKWGSLGSGNGQFNMPRYLDADSQNNIYVSDGGNHRIQKFDSTGNFLSKWTESYWGDTVFDDLVVSDGSMYITMNLSAYPVSFYGITEYIRNWAVRLNQVDEIIGSKNSRTRYLYDGYGNVITEYLDGDIATNTDDGTVHRVFYPNTTANILNKPARERVYTTITDDVGGANLKKEAINYYDSNNSSYTTPPTKGNLTRLEQKKDASNSVSSYFTYDSYGNKLTEQDPRGNATTWTYESTYHTYPATRTYPITGLAESYTFDPGTNNYLTQVDLNGQTTTYEYDTFKRLRKVIKPGDSSGSPSIEQQYNSWGTINQQHLKTLTRTSGSDYLWQSKYFDGLGRVRQTQARGETGRTIVAETITFDNRGLVDKKYVSQDLDSAQVNGYKTPESGWKYASYVYDGLERVTTQTNADGTTVNHNYNTAWQEEVTNERGYKKRYYFDAFQQLIKVEELDAAHQVYATTQYSYDVLNNLTQVKDNSNNTTSMTYDWLSRKTAMTDPDMGNWSYSYDNSGNLTAQTDAKSQTITLSYDALNRLTGKTYPAGSGMTDVVYSYDSTSGGNYGKGKRTGMADALGTTGYTYDTRGRLIRETRNVFGNNGSTASNGDNTFILYEDFEDLNLGDLNGQGGWTTGGQTSFTVSNEYGNVKSGKAYTNGTDSRNAYAYRDFPGGTNYKNLETTVVVRAAQNSPCNHGIGIHTYDTEAAHADVLCLLFSDGRFKYIDGAWKTFATNTYWYQNSWYKVAAHMLENSTVDYYVNDVKKQDDAARWFPLVNGSDRIYIGLMNSGSSVASTFYYDNIRVRKRAANEPAFTAWGSEETSGANWLSGYGYRKQMTITGSTDGAQTDYQMKLTVNKGTGTDSGSTVYLNNHAASWPGDIRFTKSDGTLLSYWMETWDASSATIWVKFHSIPASPGTANFYTYYGVVPVAYTTQYTYDGADRIVTITYPTGEVVTNNYNLRGLPNTVSGSVAGNMVTGTVYNGLGQMTEINLGNGLRTTFGYWGVGGTYDNPGGYYGKLWRIRSSKQPGDSPILQDTKHTWDAGGNLSQREDVLAAETEALSYDFLDRLNSVSGPYSESYTYNQIGNITSKNGTSYTYGSKPHAVTAVGATNYAYDANGSMAARSSQSITWDAENRAICVNGVSTFVYDGDGSRVKKTEGGQTVLYINKYYEKNLDTGEVTTSYYLGNKQVALRKGTALSYIQQDHLTGTSVISNTSGNSTGTIKYMPFGGTRSTTGTIPTDKKFTGQRLDSTGLYYYGARYYDPEIGRFISADPVVKHSQNPQAFNKYSYVLNNPLKYRDPTGLSPQAFGYSESMDDKPDKPDNHNPGKPGNPDSPDKPGKPGSVNGFDRNAWNKSGLTWAQISALLSLTRDYNYLIDSGYLTYDTKSGRYNAKNANFPFWDQRSIPFIPHAAMQGSMPVMLELTHQSSVLAPMPYSQNKPSTSTAIIVCDYIAMVGDFISIVPQAAVPGYIVSAGASIAGTILTYEDYKQGKATYQDVQVAFMNCVGGSIPYWGIVHAGYQLYWDAWRE